MDRRQILDDEMTLGISGQIANRRGIDQTHRLRMIAGFRMDPGFLEITQQLLAIGPQRIDA